MKNEKLFSELHGSGLISGESYERIKKWQSGRIISLHWDLKTLLYLGVTLLSGGLGILVYKNIDTIGHKAILTFIALLSIGSYAYCFKKARPFSWQKIEAPTILFDYILLLGCLTMLTFIGYLQYQYTVFGNKYGIATFIPMVILFFCAYYFDHLGVLSMAITNLAAWLGITITPLHLWQSNNFNSDRVIYTGICIGALLLALGYAGKKRKWKPHFEFTYNNFATHAMFVSLLAAMFRFSSVYYLWFIAVAGFTVYNYIKSVRENSFYFLVVTVLYAYVGISYVAVKLLSFSEFNTASVYISILYFMLSSFWVANFLMRQNKKLKKNDSI